LRICSYASRSSLVARSLIVLGIEAQSYALSVSLTDEFVAALEVSRVCSA